MMVLISYDVSTVSSAGKSRLRKVAKECQNHAQRVQNSVLSRFGLFRIFTPKREVVKTD